MNYYLGIDIGTTSAKAVAFSEKAEVLSSISYEYSMQHPQPDRSEQDPDEIFSAVVKGINEVLQTMSPFSPLFVSFSAAMHSFIAVDVAGSLLTQCIIWADNRADCIARDLKLTEQGKYCYDVSGVPVHSMSPLCKLLWFKENEPAVFISAYNFIAFSGGETLMRLH